MSQTIFEQIDEDIATCEQRIALLKAVRAQLAELYEAPPVRVTAKRKTRLQAGSISSRIMELLTESSPQGFPAIVAESKARKHDVKAALLQLVETGRVERIGQSRGTKYQIAA